MEAAQIKVLALIVILTGMLVGVGVLTLDKFGDATYDTNTVATERIVWPAVNGTVSFAHGNVSQLLSIANTSGTTVPSSNYTLALSTGVLTALDNTSGIVADGDNVDVSYYWIEYDSKAAVALDSARDTVSGINTTWLSLIITISVLSIIMVLVITGFGRQ